MNVENQMNLETRIQEFHWVILPGFLVSRFAVYV
jgi:hypothetical protein